MTSAKEIGAYLQGLEDEIAGVKAKLKDHMSALHEAPKKRKKKELEEDEEE